MGKPIVAGTNSLFHLPSISFYRGAWRGTSKLGRILAAVLPLVIWFLSVTLMKSHRKVELADAHSLRDLERAEFEPELHIHGEAYRDRRDRTSTEAGRVDSLVPSLRGYRSWIIGLSVFGVVAVLIIAFTIVNPALLM